MTLVPPYIETLEPYRRGKLKSELQKELGITEVVELASNENPLGSSPLALEEMRQCFENLHRYPSGGLHLREALADVHGVDPSNVIAGSGSEGIMSNIIRTFLCDDDEVLTSEGTFIGFYVLVRSRGVKMITVPLVDYRFDLRGIADRITPHTKIIYLANPNNPTGTVFTRAELDQFMSLVPPDVLIVLDEAYFEYAVDNDAYPDSLDYQHANIITLRTFSKVHGLAGVRIGYGFAHERLIQNLLKVKLPFEPSTLAQAAGIGALRDREFLSRSLEGNRVGKRMLTDGFKDLGLKPIPTDANFICVPFKTEGAAARFYSLLLRRGIIIRSLQAFGVPHALRITIGTPDQNSAVLTAFREILAADPELEAAA